MIAPAAPTVTATPPAPGRRHGGQRGLSVAAVSVAVLAVYVGTIVLANWTAAATGVP